MYAGIKILTSFKAGGLEWETVYEKAKSYAKVNDLNSYHYEKAPCRSTLFTFYSFFS